MIEEVVEEAYPADKVKYLIVGLLWNIHFALNPHLG